MCRWLVVNIFPCLRARADVSALRHSTTCRPSRSVPLSPIQWHHKLRRLTSPWLTTCHKKYSIFKRKKRKNYINRATIAALTLPPLAPHRAAMRSARRRHSAACSSGDRTFSSPTKNAASQKYHSHVLSYNSA